MSIWSGAVQMDRLLFIILTDSVALRSFHRRDRYPPISVNQYLYQHDYRLFRAMKKQLYFPPLPPSEGEESQKPDVPESPSPSTPRCPVRRPPIIWHHDQLAEIAHDLRDTILVALDFEMIDHPRHQKVLSESQRMSELGIAVYDPRDATAASSTHTIEERLQKIHVRHYIASRWRKITPMTCDAFMHTTWPGKGAKIVEHVAHPYDGVFARSRIRPAHAIRDKLQDILNRLPTRCLTAEEVAQGQRRPVILLFWDARLEIKIMSQWGIQLPAYPDPKKMNIELWDLQKWHNLQQARRNAETSDSAYNLLEPLGVLACGHNAGNDVFAILAAFLYLLHSEEEVWSRYMKDFTWFPEEYMVKLDWVDAEVAEYNERLDPNWDVGSCLGCFF
ncbi:hypothetical protein NEUTE2DRAFT_106618 [Neurospora tetrasperma FGSC 2509]|nr:hypothetical protein NEUTE2DRAFT_106618 [Neurospora tetrasperma FGSC 2509]